MIVGKNHIVRNTIKEKAVVSQKMVVKKRVSVGRVRGK